MEQIITLSRDAHDTLDFVLARNDFLDAFADLEGAICRILHMAGHSQSTESFGSRLKSLRTIDDAAQIAKDKRGQRNQLVEATAKLLHLRADIVHSRMRVVAHDGVPTAVFVNAQDSHDPDAPVRMLNLSRLRHHTQTLKNLHNRAESLRAPINPASSPPPPLPDAAGGP